MTPRQEAPNEHLLQHQKQQNCPWWNGLHGRKSGGVTYWLAMPSWYEISSSTYATLTITTRMIVAVNIETVFRELRPLRFAAFQDFPQFVWRRRFAREPQADAYDGNVVLHDVQNTPKKMQREFFGILFLSLCEVMEDDLMKSKGKKVGEQRWWRGDEEEKRDEEERERERNDSSLARGIMRRRIIRLFTS